MNVLENFKEYTSTLSLPDFVLCLAGALLLGYWLLRTSLGVNALADSRPRRNNMPLFLPFLLLFVSYTFIGVGNSIATWLLPDLQNSHGAILENLVVCISGLITVIIILISVRPFFARRLKGFGLNLKTIHKDIPAGFINLLTIWPVIMVAFTVTIYLGQFFYGPDFQMTQHEGLETISENHHLLPRIMVTIVAVLIAPLLEELLFRGLFQTMLRSFLNIKNAAWVAIAISSALFAMMHVDLSHWPAIFVLGVALGYSYEKSGSLFRSIFMHMLFNTTSVISVWIQ